MSRDTREKDRCGQVKCAAPTCTTRINPQTSSGERRDLCSACERTHVREREIDGSTAAQLVGALSQNPVGAVRGFVESAIAIAVPAQRRLGRIADGEVPSDPEVLRETLRDLENARQLLAVATEALRVAIEEPRPTSPGGTA